MYQLIRIDPALTVPAASIFQEAGETVFITVPGNSEPYELNGEPAAAIRAFLSGQIKFPVNGNLILDIHGEWTQTAKETKEWVAHGEVQKIPPPGLLIGHPTEDSFVVDNAIEQTHRSQYPGSPKIDYRRVEQRLKEGK